MRDIILLVSIWCRRFAICWIRERLCTRISAYHVGPRRCRSELLIVFALSDVSFRFLGMICAHIWVLFNLLRRIHWIAYYFGLERHVSFVYGEWLDPLELLCVGCATFGLFGGGALLPRLGITVKDLAQVRFHLLLDGAALVLLDD